jgi:hypothetical protein
MRADSLPCVSRAAKFPADPPKAKLARLYWQRDQACHRLLPHSRIYCVRSPREARCRCRASNAATRDGDPAADVCCRFRTKLRAIPSFAVFAGETLAHHPHVRPSRARGNVPVERMKEAAERYGFIVEGSNNSRWLRYLSVSTVSSPWRMRCSTPLREPMTRTL